MVLHRQTAYLGGGRREPRREQYYLHNFRHSADLIPPCGDKRRDCRILVRQSGDGFRLDTVNFYFHDQSLRQPTECAEQDDRGICTNLYGIKTTSTTKTAPK